MNAEPYEVQLSVRGERGSATIDVIHLDGNRYQIVDPLIAMLSETVAFHDIVEAESNSDDELIVHNVVEKGNFKCFSYVLSEDWHENEALQDVLRNICDLGGAWDGVFGGILMIWLPAKATYDPSNEIQEAL